MNFSIKLNCRLYLFTRIG